MSHQKHMQALADLLGADSTKFLDILEAAQKAVDARRRVGVSYEAESYVAVGIAFKAFELLDACEDLSTEAERARQVLARTFEKTTVQQGVDFSLALSELYIRSGEVFYKQNPSTEDRAALDAAMRKIEKFPFAPDVPWRKDR